jgi:hypothetical protein
MYKKKWICKTCGYETNKKQNYEKHVSRIAACKKRLSKNSNVENSHPCVENSRFCVENSRFCVENSHPCVESLQRQNDNDKSTCFKSKYVCIKCDKQLSSKRNLENHIKICKGSIDVLQCHICLEMFNSSSAKSRHIKVGKCIPCKDEKDKLIEELKQQLEESEAKRIEAENKSKTTVNYNITNNNNYYFDHSINHNNYDNLSVDHITKDDIKRLFNNCRMQYPELSEDLTRMILSPKENQCIYLPEGQKSNTCAVMKDGIEMRKPLIRVLMDLGVQTAMLIRDSNVIERNKKDVVNNQFWADNCNACGLNISDMEYMTDTDKELVQRNKNVVLDMCDGKITQ